LFQNEERDDAADEYSADDYGGQDETNAECCPRCGREITDQNPLVGPQFCAGCQGDGCLRLFLLDAFLIGD
jgi:hypothetical protein